MRLTGIVIAAALAAGCATTQGQGQGGPVREVEDYYPLAVGNSWTYEAEMLGTKSARTIQIVGQEGVFFVDDTGQKLTIDAYGLRDDKRYLLQEPIQQDHAWKNTVAVGATERYRIDSVGATCEVPAGTFKDCVFARDVGIVRIAVDLNREGTRVPQHRIQLTKYELKGGAP
jgi:hypothetical protein